MKERRRRSEGEGRGGAEGCGRWECIGRGRGRENTIIGEKLFDYLSQIILI